MKGGAAISEIEYLFDDNIQQAEWIARGGGIHRPDGRVGTLLKELE
jgi:hypothetical protein